MIVLLGVLVVVLGFATRRNPLLVVGVAGIVTGLLGKLSPLEILRTFGESFASSRSVRSSPSRCPSSACWSATASSSRPAPSSANSAPS